MDLTLSFLFLILLQLVNNALGASLDFRHISYQDLKPSVNSFSESGVTTYSKLLFDLKRNQVLVGARNALFRLSLSNLTKLEHVTWTAPLNTTNLCLAKGQTDENCHNYIKVLETNGKQVFTCGTNSFLPVCTWREIKNLSKITEWVDGIARCPYNPLANSSTIMLKSGEYYIGGPTDFSGSDFAISRSLPSMIRTKQYDSLWLNEPQFVGSFEHDKFIYFLFKEAAVEYMNCGKIVYSRIARMCKNDAGGKLMLKDNWTTFVKARLNCSVSGDYPFYYNEIQSTSYIPEENIIYATFTTPPNHIAGSAICSFNMTAIDKAFSGPFKHQRHSGSAWEKHPSHHRDHLECRESQHNWNLIEISKYQLMDEAVQATALKPLYTAELERFVHVAVDVVSTKLHASVHVMFISTTSGIIKKLAILPRVRETCVVEIWYPLPDTNTPTYNAIKKLHYSKETRSLYVGTDRELLRIPADHCRRHVSFDSCINAMDPYCGWNEFEEACTVAPDGDPLKKFWKQGVTSCPILDAIVDGGWSSWSGWSPCTHRTSTDWDTSDSCMCQTRQCNNPAPQNGGRQCIGNSIAVTNCTVHGGWTLFSAWSECSATCGFAVKTRTRTCTNPAPAHGGRVCVGPDRTEVLCTGNPPCPVSTPSPQDGQWSEWSEWDACSVPCGTGFKKRFRKCDNPSPRNGGQECIGCNVQYELCNTHLCPEQRKQTPWTHWYIMNSSNSKHEFVQRRFKYSCRGPVADSSQLKVTLYKEEERVCRDGQCYMNGYEEKWSAWSPWSECSVSCGGGSQSRNRICERGDCQGSGVQTRSCNVHPCKGEWGCWSDWSPCSVTCGWGIKKRYRPCLGESCDGSNSEEEPCEIEACDSLLGWDNWTEWSVCDQNQEQHRKRNCRTTNPGPNMCQGKNKETRICKSDYQTWGIKAETSSATAGIIIAYMSLGFLICFVMCLAFYFFYLKKRKTRIPSSPHYMSAKQNPYIAVPFQDRPTKKQSASSSGSILNNGTLKPVKYLDYETATMKRNSHGLNNSHSKAAELVGDDKLYYG